MGAQVIRNYNYQEALAEQHTDHPRARNQIHTAIAFTDIDDHMHHHANGRPDADLVIAEAQLTPHEQDLANRYRYSTAGTPKQKLNRIVNRAQAFGAQNSMSTAAFQKIAREGPFSLWAMDDPDINMLVLNSLSQKQTTGPWLVSAAFISSSSFFDVTFFFLDFWYGHSQTRVKKLDFSELLLHSCAFSSFFC